MIRDSQTSLWEAAALTSTAVSTNCYDLGAGYTTGTSNGDARDPSVGIPEGVILCVGVAADHTTGDETYEFDIITATASDLTTGQLIVNQHTENDVDSVLGMFGMSLGGLVDNETRPHYALGGSVSLPNISGSAFANFIV